MKSFLRFISLFFFVLLLHPVFGQNNRLKVAGSVQTDSLVATKIVKSGGTSTEILMADGSTVSTGNNLQIMSFDSNRKPKYLDLNITGTGESVPEVATTAYVDYKLADYYGEYANAIVSEATASQLGRIKLTGDLGGTGNSPTVPGLALKLNLSDTADFAAKFVRMKGAQTIAGNKTFSGTTNFAGNITINGVAGTSGQVIAINSSGNPAWVTLASGGGSGGISTLTAPLNISNGSLSISQASSSTNGYLSSTDWNTFNNKVNNADTTRLLSSKAKVFVPKIGGTAFSLVAGTSKDTLQIPLAGTGVAGGLLSNTTQDIVGDKTFLNKVSHGYQSNIYFRDFNNTVDEWILSRNGGDPNLPGNTNPQSYFQLHYYPFNNFSGSPAFLELSPNGDFYTNGKISAGNGFNSYGNAFYTNIGFRSGTNTDTTSFNQILLGRSPGTFIQGGNIVASGSLNTRGNITGNNLFTAGVISGGSLSTSGAITAGTNLSVGGTLTTTGNISSSGTVTGTQFIRPGGTANQFLMADGSVRNSLISEGFIGLAENNKRGVAIGTSTPSAVLHVDVSNYDESSSFNGALITSTNKDTYLKINSNNTPASAALKNTALIII